MVSLIASLSLMALTRAEIISRMKAPVITQCEGLVQVYADCPEDMRREYQMPVASFAAETVKTISAGLGRKLVRTPKANVIIHLGAVRTNETTVVTRVSTNAERIVSRIYVPSPGYADVEKLRAEVIRAYLRAVCGEEVDEAEARRKYRLTNPAARVADERQALEDWFAGRKGSENDEHYLAQMRKIIEPGKASKRDILIFASRLFLYPALFDCPFGGRFDCLSFREAVRCAQTDAWVRLAAYMKANEILVFGGGRGEEMSAASRRYWQFLLELAKAEKEEGELLDLLDKADAQLNVAMEKAK